MSAAALTGGIATGKSTVAGILAESGVALLDTDAISAEISGPGGAAIPALRDAFGAGCLTGEGALDRPKMRDIVFSDAKVRSRLESILHPMIRARVEEFLAHNRRERCVVAIPLYFETLSYLGRFDEVIVVDCATRVQRDRLVLERKMDPALADAILRAQSPRSIRLQLADRIFVNNASLELLGLQVANWVRAWR